MHASLRRAPSCYYRCPYTSLAPRTGVGLEELGQVIGLPLDVPELRLVPRERRAPLLLLPKQLRQHERQGKDSVLCSESREERDSVCVCVVNQCLGSTV